ncbi:MAG TPA: VOC family protein [Polyangiales bacterium]
MTVKAIPVGQEGPRPYICVKDGAAPISFYAKALGATEKYRLAEPGGRIGHAELLIGGSVLMLSDEYPDAGVKSPSTIGGSPVTLSLYVADVDRVAQTFVAAGGKVVREVSDQFYGDRGGKFEDPFGHIWWIATHKEDVSPEEMQRRAAAQFGQA